MGKSSGLAEKSNNRLRKHQEKHESEREKAKDDAIVEISMNTILNLRPEESEQANLPPVSKAMGKAKVATQTEVDSDEDSGVNSEVEEQERRLTEKKKKGKGKAKGQSIVKPFAQRDLVSLAFAGDKVVQVCFPPIHSIETRAIYPLIRVQDFQEAKQRETLEDVPKEVDTTLPGWVRSLSHFQCIIGLLNRAVLGLVGWGGCEENTAETIPCQEGRWHRPSFSRRLWKSSRHHLRETGQEGCEVHGQGPTIPIYKQGAIREEPTDTDRDGVEYQTWVPEGNTAKGCQEGALSSVLSLLRSVNVIFSLVLLSNLWSRCRRVFPLEAAGLQVTLCSYGSICISSISILLRAQVPP